MPKRSWKLSAMLAGSDEPELRKRAPLILSGLIVGHAHQRAVQRRVAGEEVDALLAQQLGDALRRHLVLEEQRGAVRERDQKAEVEAVAGVQRHRAQHAVLVGHAQRLADRLRGRAQVGGGLDHALRIAAHRRGELHDRRRIRPSCLRRRGSRAARACTGCTTAASPAGAGGSRARTWTAARPACRATGRRRVVGQAGGGLHALAAARARDQRAQRGRLQDHLQLAVARRRIQRDDHALRPSTPPAPG